jgi:hypothetical protein
LSATDAAITMKEKSGEQTFQKQDVRLVWPDRYGDHPNTQLAPFTMRKHRLLASTAKTMKVVSTVLHKAAQHSAFKVER